MRKHLRALVALKVYFFLSVLSAQELDVLSELASIEAEMDSLSIYNMIDQVLASEFTQTKKSEFILNAGYNSSIVSVSRDYELDQRSVFLGSNFYHKTGAFAGVSSFFSIDSIFRYDLTLANTGYIGLIGNHFSYSLMYERWFYDEPKAISSDLLENSLGASFGYSNEWINASIDYTLQFGDGSAHRFLSSLSLPIKLPKVWFFKNWQIYPTAILFVGNQAVSRVRFSSNRRSNLHLNVFSGNLNELLQLVQTGTITRSELRALLRVRELYASGQLTDAQEERLSNIIYDFVDETNFGVLGITFSIPLIINFSNTTVSVGYSYSLPNELSDEPVELAPVGYLSTSLSYRLPLK